MHPSRRRKKRPNYGIRTVEVVRGPNGFGFTISGQQPCILSCIVANSPADQAGLRAGDFLISVNGLSVSKSTHDSVVNLIGNSIGPIKMTIAENYYSDSSDEDLDLGRMVSNRKPKYMHRPRMHRNYKHEASGSSNDRLGFNSPIKKAMRLQNSGSKNTNKQAQNDGRTNNKDNNNSSVNNSILFPRENEGGPIEYKALVGYLGTIEMPKQLQPSARLQTVCSCIRKLRQEKRAPTAVLMTVLPTCLTLKNSSNQILAIYPTSRVVYISSSTDKDSRYFGLVTSAICDNRTMENVQKRNFQYLNTDSAWPQKPMEKQCNNNPEEKPDVEISNSCHVFVTDSKIIEHSSHADKAEHFKITCTPDVITGSCLEFPKHALHIVSLVQNMYKLQDSTKDARNGLNSRRSHDDNLLPVMANSPQPSASSNSDSGIGFRDDCGNISDRILVVEFPAKQHLPIIASTNKRPCGIDASSILLENLDMPIDNISSNGAAYASCTANVNNIRCKNFEHKCPKAVVSSIVHQTNACDDNKENKQSNVNNIRACENINKALLEKSENRTDDILKRQQVLMSDFEQINMMTCDGSNPHSSDCMSRLTVRAMPDPRRHSQNSDESYSRNADIDTGQIFTERPIDVPDGSPKKKSFENISMQSITEDASDFKSSADNISVHSSKSLELTNLKSVFKTPKYLENKKSSKRALKMVGSFDNLVTEKYENSMLNYKLSPKVYGMSKPNHSCEELSSIDNVEKCGYGSLQDLCSLMGQNGSAKRNIAQSEPDVRLQRQQHGSGFLCEENGVQNSKQAEAAAAWGQSFEKLLEDPIGLQTFAEFLKKEFSAENIYFWTACERFRRLAPGPERVLEAQRIYQRHLCVGASEPVNVDSQGRQCTEQSLQEADSSLFEQAQKQIFNLMKFDSYPRFLKSDLYKQCLNGNNIETSLDAGLLLQPPGSTPSKLKKSLSNAEDRRRKSLLPWHRKNRSKSKDRGETEYNQKKEDNLNESVSDVNGKNDVHSSKSSLTSQESAKGIHDDINANAAGRGPLCKVILCNGSTTVVQIRQSETIEQLVNRVLEKRGIAYSSFEVFTDKHPKSLNINDPSTILAGCEVKIEQRVVFKLDLPNRKVIAVKSKYTKILVDVLKPILNKYNYRLDQVRVTIGASDLVDVTKLVTSIDGMRLNVQLCDDLKEQAAIQPQKIHGIKVINSASLDEITNKVFKELLHEKADAKYKSGSDRGSVKSEDWGSENSSGILGRFLRRDSGIHEKRKKCLGMRGVTTKANSNHSSIEDITGEHTVITTKKPLIAKWKSGVNKLHVGACSESEKLYEGLNRAQNSRIEDQRGTEINFELPDFLKDKENAQNNCQQRVRKFRRTEDGLLDNTRFYDPDTSGIVQQRNLKPEQLQQSNNYENRNIMVKDFNGAINNNNGHHINHYNHNQNVTAKIQNATAKTHNHLRIYSPNKGMMSDESSKSNQSTPSKCNSLNNTVIENIPRCDEAPESTKGGDPPPLPPKPKILPIKPSNWGQNGLFKVPRVPRNENTKQSLYLEQPTSSFV